MKDRWAIRTMCKVLEVSESGYYGWQRSVHTSSTRRVSDQRLLAEIRAVHRISGGEYGWPRVWHALRPQGIRVGKERVRILMQTHSVRGTVKRKFVITTDSTHGLAIAPNLLLRQFNPAQLSQIWASDITYRTPRQRDLAANRGKSDVRDVVCWCWGLAQYRQAPFDASDAPHGCG